MLLHYIIVYLYNMNKIEHSIILGYKDIYKKSFDEDFLESLKGFKSEDLIYILVQIITWIEEKKETHFILDKITKLILV